MPVVREDFCLFVRLPGSDAAGAFLGLSSCRLVLAVLRGLCYVLHPVLCTVDDAAAALVLGAWRNARASAPRQCTRWGWIGMRILHIAATKCPVEVDN